VPTFFFQLLNICFAFQRHLQKRLSRAGIVDVFGKAPSLLNPRAHLFYKLISFHHPLTRFASRRSHPTISIR